MRMWHYKMLSALPDAQFKGQLRELVAILHDWRDKGKTNHILINKIMNYPKSHLFKYFCLYREEYFNRYGKDISSKIVNEFIDFCGPYNDVDNKVLLFRFWHTKSYLRICMANLYEKYLCSSDSPESKAKLTDDEMLKLLENYHNITGEIYTI